MSRTGETQLSAITVLVTFEELRRVVDPIRGESLLPSGEGLSLAEVIPPHMTVASPACPDPFSDAAGARLRHCVEGLDQFEVRFSQVGTFPQGTVFLIPDSNAELDRLLARVADGFAEFGGVRDDHVWHLSVSRRGGDVVARQFRSTFRPLSALSDPGIDLDASCTGIAVGDAAPCPTRRTSPVKDQDPARLASL